MADILIIQQGTDVAPTPDGFKQVTNPLHPARRASSRFAHFTDDVYDLGPESHLSRLLKTLLGDVGVGQLNKRSMLARIQSVIGGVHFFDLDAFFGAILGITRRSSEILTVNPYTDEMSVDEWDQVRIRDASYRSRIQMFAQGLNLGATPAGIEAVAEAMLGCEVDVDELWRSGDRVSRTYGQLDGTLWGAIEGLGTYGDVESIYNNPLIGRNRHTVNVYPRRLTTYEERYAVQTALERIKPAGSLISIQTGTPNVYIPIPISAITADSTQWEVRTDVRNTRVGGRLLYSGAEDSFVSVPVQPWGSYQGEAWSRMAENPVALAYTTPQVIRSDIRNDPTATDLPPERVRVSEEDITFTPALALRPYQGIMAGRVASDGVISANPMTGWGNVPTYNPGTAFSHTLGSGHDVSQVRIEGIPIDDFVIATASVSSGRLSELFWTSPVRDPDAPDADVIEIRFDAYADCNNVSFEIAAFPQHMEVQVWDVSSWRTVDVANFYSSNPAGITGRTPAGFIHPFHFGSGHWVRITSSFDPVTTNAVRFVFTRNGNGNPPKGVDGKATAYPLGIRFVDIGYRISSEAAIPARDEANPLVVTKNALGQTIRHYVHRYSTSLATDNQETFWKCEAQPIAQAVVNVYLDVSDAAGQPTVFDRIYVDPYNTGPTVSVYYGNAVTDQTQLANAPSIDRPIIPVSQGSINSIPTGDRGIIWPLGQAAWYDFDNNDLGVTSDNSWWFSIEMYLSTSRAQIVSLANDAVIFSDGPLDGAQLSLVLDKTTGGLTMRIGGKTHTFTGFYYTPGQKIIVTGRWDADLNTISLGVLNPDGVFNTTSSAASVSHVSDRPSHFLIGNAGNTNISPAMRIIRAAFGFGKPALSDVAINIQDRSRRSVFGDDLTTGTFLRYHPDYEGWSSVDGQSIGWMGGQPQFWDQIAWAPVAQDYSLAKGYIRIPQVHARYVKLEFTNLVPEPYEPFLSHPRSVKVFPNLSTSTPPLNNGDQTSIAPAPIQGRGALSEELRSIGGGRYFTLDSTSQGGDRFTNQVRPTTGIVALDPIVAARLGERAGLGWNLMEWQPARVPSQFYRAGVHTYDTVNMPHNNKVGFFVGLREVSVCRSGYQQPTDNVEYIDKFFDFTHIASYTSDYNPGVFLTSPSSVQSVLPSPVQVFSKQFDSRSRITALQFATQQSPPTQVIPDDLFKDPGLIDSPFGDSAKWHVFGDGIAFYDAPTQSVKLSRDPSVIFANIKPDTPMVHPPITPVFTTRPAVTNIVTASSSGGIESPQVLVSPSGAVYAATRVTATTNLIAPLWLQIVGTDGVTVLHEESFMPQIGIIVEYTMAYILSGLANEASMRVRVIQKGASQGTWLMHALSLFDDSVLWEFSNDGGKTWVPAVGVRNNYNGLVSFPSYGNNLRWRCSMYRHSIGIDSIKIRPWYENKIVS